MMIITKLLVPLLLFLFIVDVDAQTITATRFSDGDSTSYTCDGVDDHIQINLALEYVKDSGGVVKLSADTFYIDSALYIAGNNTTMQGAGMYETTIKLVDDAGWCYYYKNLSGEWVLHSTGPMILNKKEATKDLTISNLKIDGNKYNQYLYNPITGDTIRDTPLSHTFDGQGHYPAIDFRKRTGSTESVSDILFHKVFIYENSDDGLMVFNGSNITVDSCKGIRGGHSVVYFLNPMNLLVEHCDFMVTSNSGIRWYDGNHIIIRGNHVYGEPEKTGNSNFCIQMTSGQSSTITNDLLIDNNNLEFTAGAGIALDAKDSKAAKDAIIRNNIILQCGNTGTTENIRESGGINLKNFTNTLIENNTIVNCLGGGIRLGGNVGFNTEWPYETGLTATIKNNIISNTIDGGNSSASGYGIDIASGNSAECTFNNLWQNASGDYHGCEAGMGSITFDPNFKSIVLGSDFYNTNDTTADLHLKSETGRWNSTNSTWETDTVSSICINGGDPNGAYENEPAENGGRLNLGAYGNTIYASKGSDSPPVADAGPDLYIRDDNDDDIVFVVLDGSNSMDNGSIVSYTWKRNGAVISTSEIDTVPFVLGQVNVSLEVIDNDGISSIDNTLVKILPYGANINPVSNAGSDIVATDIDNNGIQPVTLNGSGSYDVDAILVAYEWSENGIVLETATNPTVFFPVGTHTVVLKVTDNEGGTDVDTVMVTILPKGNYALEFSNDFNNEVVKTSNFHAYSTYTIEMWVKQATFNDDAALLYLGGDGKRAMLKTSSSYPSWDETWNNTSDSAISQNTWHHLAYVVENDSLIAIYVDGAPSSISNPTEILPNTTLDIASFYGSTDAVSSNFKGIMDELRYWNTARTQAQINDNKNIPLTGNEAGLAAYWDFNDGSGNRLTDLAGIADGTLFNMENEDWVTDTPPIETQGNTYYVDALNGNDNNDGLTEASAWQTIAKVNENITGLSGGDTVLFKRGEVWKGTSLNIHDAYGLSDANIVFGAYGSGEKPIISSVTTRSHNWIDTGGNIWKATNPPADNPGRLLIDGVEKLRANIQSELDGISCFWRYNDTTNNLFIYSDTNPNGNVVLQYATDYPIQIGYANNIVIENIDVQGGQAGIFINTMAKNITLDSLNIGKNCSSGIIINSDSIASWVYPESIVVNNCNFNAWFSFDYSTAGTYSGSTDRGCNYGIKYRACSGGELKNCYFKNWGNASIALDGGVNTKVSGLSIHNNYLTSPDICYGGRLLVNDAIHNNIYHNEIISTSAQSRLNGQYNTYHHNIFKETKNCPLITDYVDGGIELQALSNHEVKENIYENNVIINTEGPGFRIAGNNDYDIHSNIFRNNILFNCGSAVNGKSLVIEDDLSSVNYNNSIINNSVYNSLTTQTCDFKGATSNVSGFNAFSGTDGYIISDNIATDPLFQDEPNNDYHLQNNSPCIDAGTEALSKFDYDNNPVPLLLKTDIGLYEYGIYWNGSISHYWNVAGNWSNNQVPAATDIVTIPKKEFYNYYPKVFNNAQVKKLYLQENAKIELMSNVNLGIY